MVRIQIESLRHFVEDLRTTERDRRGEATLICSQLRLSLSIVDRAGHAHLSVTLTQFQVEGDHQVTVGFAVYPTDLPHILKDFEDMLEFPQPPGGSDEDQEN